MTAEEQKQMYWGAFNRSARANEAFLDLVKDGLTKRELTALIEKRPGLYRRFEKWIAKLKD